MISQYFILYYVVLSVYAKTVTRRCFVAGVAKVSTSVLVKLVTAFNAGQGRSVEFKHGRIAMLATMGFMTPEIIGHWPGDVGSENLQGPEGFVTGFYKIQIQNQPLFQNPVAPI